MADQNPTWGLNFKFNDPTTWLPTFGNWCGPDWSAGAKSTTPQLTTNQLLTGPTRVNGQDSLIDILCKAHDKAYSDAYGQPNSRMLILKADVSLEKGLAA